jgi:hypothetical protein
MQAARDTPRRLFDFAATASRYGEEKTTMWNEWLARTLRVRRAERDAVTVERAPTHFARLPDLECDGMHPGADEYRAAIEAREVEKSS